MGLRAGPCVETREEAQELQKGHHSAAIAIGAHRQSLKVGGKGVWTREGYQTLCRGKVSIHSPPTGPDGRDG